ncbi:hypothetical protein D3C80_512310 [compost metagenome]
MTASCITPCWVKISAKRIALCSRCRQAAIDCMAVATYGRFAPDRSLPAAATASTYDDTLLGHEGLGFRHGVLTEVEDARRQHCAGVAFDDSVGQMLQITHTT